LFYLLFYFIIGLLYTISITVYTYRILSIDIFIYYSIDLVLFFIGFDCLSINLLHISYFYFIKYLNFYIAFTLIFVFIYFYYAFLLSFDIAYVSSNNKIELYKLFNIYSWQNYCFIDRFVNMLIFFVMFLFSNLLICDNI
jgi:hypothetical protein